MFGIHPDPDSGSRHGLRIGTADSDRIRLGEVCAVRASAPVFNTTFPTLSKTTKYTAKHAVPLHFNSTLIAATGTSQFREPGVWTLML